MLSGQRFANAFVLLSLLRVCSTKVPCDQSRRILNISKIKSFDGYTILRCLGEGSSHEVWSVRGPNGIGALKILKPSSRNRDRDTINRSVLALSKRSATECLKGQLLHAHRPDLFVTCYKHGIKRVANHRLPYTVHQVGRGFSLKHWSIVANEHFYGKMMPKLVDVLNLMLRIWSLRKAPGHLPIKQVNGDLNWGNIMLAKNLQDMMFVDYDKHHLCIQVQSLTAFEAVFGDRGRFTSVLPVCWVGQQKRSLRLHLGAVFFASLLILIIIRFDAQDVLCLEQRRLDGFGSREANDGYLCKLLTLFFQSGGGRGILVPFSRFNRNLSNALTSRMHFQYVEDWKRCGLEQLFVSLRKDFSGIINDFVERDPQFIHLIREAVVRLS